MTKPEKLHMLHGPFTSFIQKIIPKDLSGAAPVFCIQRTPLSAGNAWTALTQLELLNQLQRQSYTADSSYYISTMLSTGGRNKKDQFGGLMFIVVDDVGSKGTAKTVDDLPLKPTWVIESSKNSFQCGYLFTNPIKDKLFAVGLVKHIYGAGIGDKGGALINKFVRLPGGIRNKIIDEKLDNFQVTLQEIDETKTYDANVLAKAFGYNQSNHDTTSNHQSDFLQIESSRDPFLSILNKLNLVIDNAPIDIGEGRSCVKIICPWVGEHTNGDETGTYYYFGGGFKCYHSHGDELSFKDVKKFLRNEHDIDTGTASVELDKVVAEPWINSMNKDYFICPAGAIAVWREERDDNGSWTGIEPMNTGSFHTVFANQLVPWGETATGKIKYIEKSRAWIKSNKRREYVGGMGFDPGGGSAGNTYNSWQGFSVEPNKGDWSLFKDHIETIICNGVKDHSNYLLQWMAHVIQNGSDRAHVAIVLRTTEEGTGKGKFAEIFGELFGAHYSQVDQAKRITGDFNETLDNCKLLFLDEAMFAGDPKQVAPLFRLITEPTNHINRKGVSPYSIRNVLAIIMASNRDQVIPAGRFARRFFCPTVSAARCQDTKYFAAIDDQMLRNDGLSAMLFDLMEMDISKFNIRDIPQTEQLLKQKWLNAGCVERWLAERIESEKLTKETSFFTSWTDPILKMSVYEDYEYFCDKTRDIFTPKNTSHFWRTIKNMKIKVIETRRKPTQLAQLMQSEDSSSHPSHLYVEFPPRKLCRKALETYLSGGKAVSSAG
jgi:hypothetical protein